MYSKFFKRLLDVVLSFFGLLFLSIPMLIVAIAIKIESPGPAVFKNERVGKDGKVFYCYKFRSMRIDAPNDQATRYIDSEKYITKLGKVIRKLSIDELPQLLNILKGEMSIIGYRPVVTTETELLDYRKKYGVEKFTPGLTGLAQISGRDELIDMEKKAQIDATYCNNITFLNDCRIFFKTILVVLRADGIVEGKEAIKVKNPIENEKEEVENIESTEDK